ncbi:hypothetical protein ACHAW5_008424 [Stephanodiscus triporus]|uniref:Amine oxidase domain-containing protein n=1 Tax=Stephanodiscus triporus TaxID=2934178 RepID=A0ABD3PH81_9STRA
MGRYEWKKGAARRDEEDGAASNDAIVAGAKRDGDDSPEGADDDVVVPPRSPNYVSDDTADNGDDATIDPTTDFGTVFEECRRHLADVRRRTNGRTGGDGDNGKTSDGRDPAFDRNVGGDEVVRHNLFQWHVANLEMSAGAPMNMLGQKWNDDEPFGYGGDHSYLEGGMRDLVEALAQGFECRGVGGVRSATSSPVDGMGYDGNRLRRSGDFASIFSSSFSWAGGVEPFGCGYGGGGGGNSNNRGVIQCGIEVTGVEILEKEEVKLLRMQKRKDDQPPRLVGVDKPSLRRSTRETRGLMNTSFIGAPLSSRSRGVGERAKPSSLASNDETASPPLASSYGNEQNTVVRVTTKCGLTLEADAVIVTLPLAILSIPQGSPGHISFNPPLPSTKRNALNRLGVGAYNKCCMSFEKPFWNNLPRHSSVSAPVNRNDEMTQKFDFIGHASSEHGKDILFFSLMNSPILVAIYGGSDYSKQVEDMKDDEVVMECMKVLKKICESAIKARDDSLRTRRQVDLAVPDWPIDYFVSRWGSDPYSRGAFCYVPNGVNGFEELTAMSTPIYDFRPEWAEETDKPKRPLIMFAGEATTPYHPSTIHGAYESGIREAYRLDLALEPTLTGGITFDESYLYQPTFSVRRGQADPISLSYKAAETGTIKNVTKNDAKVNEWWFDHDASILRGVETFGSSSKAMSTIKAKMLAHFSNTHSEKEMEGRYKSLMGMFAANDAKTSITDSRKEWDTPGQRGTWLATDVAQGSRLNFANAKLDNCRDDSQTRRSSRNSRKKHDEFFFS